MAMNPHVSLPKSVVTSPDALFQNLTGEVIILHMGSDLYFRLDDIGSEIWLALADHGDPEAVVASILTSYDVDEATFRRDLSTLIADLGKHGLIEIHD
jgi:hypothetical protein